MSNGDNIHMTSASAAPQLLMKLLKVVILEKWEIQDPKELSTLTTTSFRNRLLWDAITENKEFSYNMNMDRLLDFI